jgi:hypothetical protein
MVVIVGFEKLLFPLPTSRCQSFHYLFLSREGKALSSHWRRPETLGVPTTTTGIQQQNGALKL